MPIEVALDKFNEVGWVPDYARFVDDALDRNWNPRTIRSKLSEAVGDVYGSDYKERWLVELEKYLEVLGKP